MATRKRHSAEQVVRKLTQADRILAEGKDIGDVCRELEVSEQTYYRWRNQFGGLKAEHVKQLKDVERQNATLKRLLGSESSRATMRRPDSRSPGLPSAGGSFRQARGARVHLRADRCCGDQREGQSEREIVVEGADFGAPDDGGQCEGGLEHGEVVADAGAGACAEGDVLPAVAARGVFRGEPIRVELAAGLPTGRGRGASRKPPPCTACLPSRDIRRPRCRG